MSSVAIEVPAAVAAAQAVVSPVRQLVSPGSILLPVNGQSAARVAAEHLARSMGGVGGTQVHLLHVTPFIHRHIGRFLPARAAQDYARQRAAAAIDPVLRLLKLAGVNTTVHVARSRDVAAEIIAVANREQCTRIVMGATRKSALVRSVTNSVTGRVLAGAPMPVEIIAGNAASAWQRIGVPAGVGAGLALAALMIELD